MIKEFESDEQSNGMPYELELKQSHSESVANDRGSGTYESLETVDATLKTQNVQQLTESAGELNEGHRIHLLSRRKFSPKHRMRRILITAGVVVLTITLAVLFYLFLSSRDKGQENVTNKLTTSQGDRCLNYSKKVPNGKITDFTGTNHGDSFKIGCDSGNKLIGHNIVTCLSSNHWSESPICQPEQCDRYIPPEHAKLVFINTSRIAGAEIEVICKDGFRRKGNSVVTCQKNETWSKSPACEPVNCGYPESVANGILNETKDITYNSSFSVYCTDGYKLIGASKVICKISGHWSDMPVCMPVICDVPVIPQNGHITYLSGTTFGSTARLKCNENFYLNGNPEIICTSNGTWTDIPKCEINVADCGMPSSVVNGEIIGLTNAKYNSTFSVRCKQGYTISANETIVCGVQGTWSNIPTCKPISCGFPRAPNNGYTRVSNGTTYMSSVLIECERGYSIKGKSEITCSDQGKWTAIPLCEPVDCGLPRNVMNGEITRLIHTTYNSSFSVHCHEGYILLGLNSVKCERDGNWTKVPSCIRQTDCGDPPNIPHGSITGFTNTSFGSTLFVTCNDGYSLNGTDSFMCGNNDQWQNIPKCIQVVIPCGLPDIPVNGAIESIQGTAPNKFATIKCKPGFILKGQHIVTCVNDGKWSEIPICAQDCGTPPIVTNGGLKNTKQSGTFSVQCDNGYNLTGEETIKCEVNGRWTDPTKCEPVSCGLPDISQNQMLVFINGTTFNAIARMKCEDGFTTLTNSVIRCQSNGSWTYTPACKRIDCGLPNIPNSGYAGNIITSFGSTLNVSCNVGYSLLGTQAIHCGEDGMWGQLPTCKLVQCGFPKIPSNGAIDSIQGMTLNKTAVIKCISGFVLNGTSILYCLANGEWSESPKCIPDCGLPPNISNGEIKELSYTRFNSSFYVECDEGYVLTGHETVRCGSNGKWSAPPACITQTDCGVPPNITYGVIREHSSTDVTDKFYVTCKDGFVLTGDHILSCDPYGAWSDLPTCGPTSCGVPLIPNYRKLFSINVRDDVQLSRTFEM